MLQINYLAVLIAGIIPMLLGGLWYSPLLFAKPFMSLIGRTKEDMMKDFNPAVDYALMFLANLLMAYILAHFINYTKAVTFGGGMETGFWLWLGFVVTTNASTVIFEGRKPGLFYINMGYQLISLEIMGAVLAVWQ